MKLLGCMMILLSAGGIFLSAYSKAAERTELTKALADDLAVLRCGICIYRRTLDQILRTDLGQGEAAQFWLSLAALLDGHEGTVRACWEQAAAALPPPLDSILQPLGALLPAGGETFDRAVSDARNALLTCLNKQAEERSVKLRLTAAMCFSAAVLVILVCI